MMLTWDIQGGVEGRQRAPRRRRSRPRKPNQVSGSNKGHSLKSESVGNGDKDWVLEPEGITTPQGGFAGLFSLRQIIHFKET